MAKQRFDPERDLRAWADALNTVADLQHAIVDEASQIDMIVQPDRHDSWDWLKPFRSIVSGTIRNFPDRAKEETTYEAAIGLKETATNALARLRIEAQKRKTEATH